MNLKGRLQKLEARVPPPRSSARARGRMKDLLDRYASAKQAGTITEELETEFRVVSEAVRRRLAAIRGEGVR